MPAERFQRRLDAVLREAAGSAGISETLQQRIAGCSVQVELDSTGRLLLPLKLLEATGITREVALVGCLDKFEIWDAACFAQTMTDNAVSDSNVFRAL